MPAGYRHRSELRSLTPEQRADFAMTERDHEAALDMPVTDYPAYAIARNKWERRILSLLGRVGITEPVSTQPSDEADIVNSRW